MFDIILLLYENFDTCQHYDVDKYLTSLGLIVVEKYRGRGIGEHFLRTRKAFCEAFGIKLTSTLFTSNYSNRIADKVGFKPVKSYRWLKKWSTYSWFIFLMVNILYKYINEMIFYSFSDIRNDHPEFKLPPLESQFLTLKSIVYWR